MAGRRTRRRFPAGLPGLYTVLTVLILASLPIRGAEAEMHGDGRPGRAKEALLLATDCLAGTSESPKAESIIASRLCSGELPGEFRYAAVLAGNGHGNLLEEFSLITLKKHITADGSFDIDLRTALSLAYSGSPVSVSYIDSAVDYLTDNGTINVKLYILRLAEAGYGSAGAAAVPELTDYILSRQLADGGWAFSGEKSDPDMTAMVLCSLSRTLASAVADGGTEADALGAAVGRGLGALSAMQRDDGGFASFGNKNSESSAQVIIALSSLGIDAGSDPAFVKNGKSVIDALTDFQLPDGSFSHLPGGKSDAGATAQCFEALSAYTAFLSGNGGFTHIPSPDREAAATAVLPEPDTVPGGEDSAEITHGSESRRGLKAGIAAALVITAAAVCVIMFIRGKRKPGSFIPVILIGVALSAAVLFTDIRTPGGEYAVTEKNNPTGEVRLVISCVDVAGKTEKYPSVPADGMILGETVMKIAEGDTVYTVLCDAAAKFRIMIDAGGTGGSVYVRAIAGLGERDFGDLSGWTFSVNGVFATVGCGAFGLSDGDVIVWNYTADGSYK
ncbi:MAG: DUF4430 domain-containing protein [Clostridia bacterium]|nr:DUF4430 domain-containing protein [Clostridia bacterium]